MFFKNKIFWSNGYSYDLDTKEFTTVPSDSPSRIDAMPEWFLWKEKVTNLYATTISYSNRHTGRTESLPPVERMEMMWPDVSGDMLVYVIKNELYIYNLSTEEGEMIDNSGSPLYPVIEGNKIVWKNNGINGFSRIYFYDIETKEKKQLSSIEGVSAPDISGDIVVWMAIKNGLPVIMCYDFKEGKEKILTFMNKDRVLPAQGSGSRLVKISGERVVWHYVGTDDLDIFCYNIKTKRQHRITFDKYNAKRDPRIEGDKLIWKNVKSGINFLSLASIENGNFPLLDPMPDEEIEVGEMISNEIRIKTDNPSLGLKVTLDNGLPVSSMGASFENNQDGTGTFMWEPQEGQEGECSILVEANNGFYKEEVECKIMVKARPSREDKALFFKNGYIPMENESSSVSPERVISKTTSLWYCTADTKKTQVICEEGGEKSGLNMYIYAGRLWVGAWSKENQLEKVWLSTPTKSASWNHVAIVYEYNDLFKKGTLALYHNGGLVAQTNFDKLFVDNQDGNALGAVNETTVFHIGSPIEDTFNFLGALDECVFYNRALSHDEIKKLKKMGPDIKDKGLINYYSFNTLNDGKAIDVSASKHHQKLVGDLSLCISDRLGRNKHARFDNGSIQIDTPEKKLAHFQNSISSRAVVFEYNAKDVVTPQILYQEGDQKNGFNLYLSKGKIWAGAWSHDNKWQGEWLSIRTSPNQWHQVALDFDVNKNTFILYHDGIAEKCKMPINPVMLYLPGDANRDGKLDDQDGEIILKNFRNNIVLSKRGINNRSDTWADGDFNGNGQVDVNDYGEWKSNFKQPVREGGIVFGKNGSATRFAKNQRQRRLRRRRRSLRNGLYSNIAITNRFFNSASVPSSLNNYSLETNRYFYTGSMNKITVFNRSLGSDEISNLKIAVPLDTEGLVTYISMANGNCTDESKYSNHLQINGTIKAVDPIASIVNAPLLAHLKFDEGFSLNGNENLKSETPSPQHFRFTDGINKRAIVFDRKNSLQDGQHPYIYIKQDPSLNLTHFKNGMTLGGWIKPEDSSVIEEQGIVHKVFSTVDYKVGYRLTYSDNNQALSLRLESGENSVTLSAPQIIVPNEWNHFVVILTSQSVRFFVNGEHVYEEEYNLEWMGSDESFFIIGNDRASITKVDFTDIYAVEHYGVQKIGTHFRGAMDDFMVFNGTLTENEVASLYDYQKPNGNPSNDHKAPSDLELDVISEAQIDIFWNDNMEDEDGFNIYWSTKNEKPIIPNQTLPANQTLFNVTGLSHNTVYYFWVEAYNVHGVTAFIHNNAPTDDAPPLAPSDLVLHVDSYRQIIMSWTDHSDREDGYHVYWSAVNNKPTRPNRILLPGQTSTRVAHLLPDTTYYFWVEAFNHIGPSDEIGGSSKTMMTPENVVPDQRFRESINHHLLDRGPVPDLISLADLQNLKDVTYLKFNAYGIKNLEGLNLIGNIGSVTHLQLRMTFAPTLPVEIFDKLKLLTDLRLEGVSLKTLPIGIFDNLKFLTKLKLENNSIETLPAGIFDKLTSLKELRLRKTHISSLSPDIFNQLTSLTSLYIDRNKLKTLSSGIFDQLTSLINLNLNENSIENLPPGIFDQLSSLVWFDLDKNSLKTLPFGIFDELTFLKELDISSNPTTFSPSTEAIASFIQRNDRVRVIY